MNSLLSDNEKKLLDFKDLRDLPRNSKLYKYLTWDNAVLMLKNYNLQFTTAKNLNDKEDCNISMINFDYLNTSADTIGKQIDNKIIDSLCAKLEPQIDNFHICSLGTSYHNKTLWERYACDNGICIELDYENIINHCIETNKMVAAYMVNYVPNTKNIVPFKLFQENEIMFFYLLLYTKNIEKWEPEEEARIVLIEKNKEPFVRINLSKQCYSRIITGKSCTDKQIIELMNIVKDKKLEIDLVHLKE